MSNPINERIDRFERYMNDCVIGIAEELARAFEAGVGPLSRSGFFILAGVSSYFETINQYLTGQDSEGKSKPFFRQGFKAVYPATTLSDDEIGAIYKWLRCGMYHSTMPKHNTYLHRD